VATPASGPARSWTSRSRQGDLDLVAVAHYPDNGKSKRAIEKYVERYGGRQEGLFRNNIVYADGTVVDEVRYTVSQTEYREAVAESS
jgi:hypothetical protein